MQWLWTACGKILWQLLPIKLGASFWLCNFESLHGYLGMSFVFLYAVFHYASLSTLIVEVMTGIPAQFTCTSFRHIYSYTLYTHTVHTHTHTHTHAHNTCAHIINKHTHEYMLSHTHACLYTHTLSLYLISFHSTVPSCDGKMQMCNWGSQIILHVLNT